MSYERTNEEYKGHSLKVVSDDNPQSPEEWGDDGAFLCAWHRDMWVSPPGMRESRDPEAWIDAFKDTHWIFPVEAYIHSGVHLSLSGEGNYPDRRWDVCSSVGAVCLTKSEWKTRKAKRTRAAALATVEEWNQYLSGDVWGYIVEHEPSGWEDSCWGFYGDEYCEQEARDAIDWHVEKLRKDKIEQVKTWIRNRVPLSVRAAALV